ncbi:PREDICTED: nuclear cap-binding protein subunit 1-like isoform X1 [Populus euphratica]|uniref:Nuclear cap-binding protein subunit 1-like isoform X1 n=1 Tax=Populus euphratica TaxID=75702 RepID=A0AAJ6VE26_POPEU|nr:PREDICTED: nuclear cap-binding protein subunit 1-like isoform X1 [Populus euphratica]
MHKVIVGLLNSENEDFVKKMVETTQDNFQQVPEEIESVMVGIEAYLSIKRHNSDTCLSFFEDDNESGSDVVEKDFLEGLWGLIQVRCGNGWKVDSDRKFYSKWMTVRFMFSHQ